MQGVSGAPHRGWAVYAFSGNSLCSGNSFAVGNLVLYVCLCSIVARGLFPGNEAQPADFAKYDFPVAHALWDGPTFPYTLRPLVEIRGAW